MIDVFEYFDHRKLLKDLYEERKSRDPKFSYRYIGMKAGFKSAGYFNHVLTGKTNMSLHMALKIADVFKMKKYEVEYFELLVLFNQAKTQDEKRRYFHKIISLKKTKHKILGKFQYDFFRKWYYVAVREVLSYYLFKDDFKELAKMVRPAITESQAKKSIQVLEQLNLVRKNPDGYYERMDATLTTGDIWQSMAITDFQINTLDLAKKSYDLFDGKHRAHSTLSLSISEQDFKQIKNKLSGLRREILELALNCSRPDRVYQVNFNIFPLSRIDDEG